MKALISAAIFGSLTISAFAASLPEPARDDARIRYVTYSKDDVIVINVQRGTATRIVLAEDEKIIKDGSATGFPSDCAKAELEWCVHADVGANQVLVKPKDGATHNNLELRTNARDYSFAFNVLPDVPAIPIGKQPTILQASGAPMYRVIFRYPPRTPGIFATVAHSNSDGAVNGQSTLAERLDQDRPIPKNWKYSMQVVSGSEDIAPALVFDDGRFTYLSFPANREIPTIYAVSPQGEEARVNFHMDATKDGLAVVERTSRRFILRLGKSTVGLWNDAFDPNGIAPNEGTTVAGVARVLREGK